MAHQFELNERVTWTHGGVERPGMVSEVREDGKVYYVDMADNLAATPVTVIALESELKFRPLFEVEAEGEATLTVDALAPLLKF